MRRLAALVFSLALVTPAHAAEVTVYAAASLKESLDAVAKAFEARTKNHVVVSYGASNAMARQIESGAPADIFISADTDWVDYLSGRDLVAPGSRRNLLANALVLIAPLKSATRLRLEPRADIAGALGDRRIALGNPDSVPAGKYAKAAFTALGLWKGLEGKIAAAENVRAALAFVAREETPLGVVYRTDALAEPMVRIVDMFPAGTHRPIVYPMVVLKRATRPSAGAFADFLASPEARAIFSRFGFTAP
jgi:molybdate transport system substrate-binding protein